MIGKIGEGTYGVVYLARSRGARSRLLAVKTFKPGKVRPSAGGEQNAPPLLNLADASLRRLQLQLLHAYQHDARCSGA